MLLCCPIHLTPRAPTPCVVNDNLRQPSKSIPFVLLASTATVSDKCHVRMCSQP